LNDGFQLVAVNFCQRDGSGSGVIIIITVVKGTPTGINLPTKWCGGVGGVVVVIIIIIPIGMNPPTDGGGPVDGMWWAC